MTSFPPEPRAGSTLPVPPGSRRPHRVLVVEDNKDLRTCIREVFEMAGLAVDTTSNGLDAVQRATRLRYDVMVSDIQLPGMNGLAVTRSLASIPHPPRVILITAYPDWKVLKEANEAGAEQVLYKPLDLRKLAQTVGELAAREPRDA